MTSSRSVIGEALFEYIVSMIMYHKKMIKFNISTQRSENLRLLNYRVNF